jgi:hypothetical protein
MRFPTEFTAACVIDSDSSRVPLVRQLEFEIVTRQNKTKREASHACKIAPRTKLNRRRAGLQVKQISRLVSRQNPFSDTEKPRSDPVI